MRVTGTVAATQSGTWNIGTLTTLTSITNAVTIQDGGNVITVDGTVNAAQSGTWNIGTLTSISNVVQVADNAGSLTVDGTVAATQSGTWDVGTVTSISQLGGQAIAMGTGVRSAGTLRVTVAMDDVVPASQSGTWNITNVSGTVSLPTGAATAAKQPALGTAGTASADVITVQGRSSRLNQTFPWF